MTQSTWGNMLNQKAVTKPKEGYAMHHLEHVGENPMYQEHMAKAFKPSPAKVKINTPNLDTKVGSPWQMMAKGK